MKKEERNLPTSGANLGRGSLESKRKTLGKTEKKILISLTSLFLLAIVGSVSYAFIGYNTKQQGINVLETDCINVEMEELTNAIRLTNAYPITDEVGNKTKPFQFKLTNTCGVGVDYNLNLEVMDTQNRIASSNIATKVNDSEKSLLNSNKIATPTYKESDYTAVEAYTLLSGEIKPYNSVTHEIRIWLDESAGNETQNGTFYSKVVIEAVQNQITEYKESILNGADPVLKGNLIAVEIDDTGNVTRADLNEAWYSYANKKWANAVILEDETVSYEVGDVIPEENIESYFVWIPKYSYELWDLGEYDSLTNTQESKIHEIPIKFGLTNTSDGNEGECTTPMLSGESGNCKVGDYMTHPAFISMGTNGLWVGKFETGYKEATSTIGAEVNANDASKVEIKPNVYSWRNINVSNAFETSYSYQRELDSHMMKNTEWGAVAYLQHSAYGSATSVRINNNSGYVTGYAATEEPTLGYNGGTSIEGNRVENKTPKSDGTYTINYLSSDSQVASTTGNYSGIYDMSGGAWEYVMSVMLDSTNTNPLIGDSGFTTFPNEKYYDAYLNNTSSTVYNKRILGDATGEMGPFANVTYGSQTRQIGSWYNDDGLFIESTSPWFMLGGNCPRGVGTGVFASGRAVGDALKQYGFRIVLAI